MTKITVLGGTGYAGSAIVREAKARGHEVTSVSRSKPSEPMEGVTYVTSPAAEAAKTLKGADIVIAALSPRGDTAGTLPGLYRSLAQEAARAGARFVVIGGFGSLRPAEGQPRFVEGDQFPPDYRPEAEEMLTVLKDLQAGTSNADWLFISPAMEFGSFAPGEALGHYRVSGEVALFDKNGTSAISGADFARAILDEVEKPAHHKAHIHFAY